MTGQATWLNFTVASLKRFSFGASLNKFEQGFHKKVAATQWLPISSATGMMLGHIHHSCINILQIFIKPGCGFCAIWQSTRGAWRGAGIVKDHCTAEGWGLNDKVCLTP